MLNKSSANLSVNFSRDFSSERRTVIQNLLVHADITWYQKVKHYTKARIEKYTVHEKIQKHCLYRLVRTDVRSHNKEHNKLNYNSKILQELEISLF